MTREMKLALVAGLVFLVGMTALLTYRSKELPEVSMPPGGDAGGAPAGEMVQNTSSPSFLGGPVVAPPLNPPKDSDNALRAAAANGEPTRLVQKDAREGGNTLAAGSEEGSKDDAGRSPRSSTAMDNFLGVENPGGLSREEQPTDLLRLRSALEKISWNSNGRTGVPALEGGGSSRGSFLSVNPLPEKDDMRKAALAGHRAKEDGGEAPARHKVGKGETLSALARKYLGSSTPKNIRILYEANRDILKSPNSVREGQELRIPAMPSSKPAGTDKGAGSNGQEAAENPVEMSPRPESNREKVAQAPEGRKQGAAPEATAKADEAAKDPAGPSWRWYQIQSNDRLISIARDELGDSRRWKEILDLNRDRIPDPNRIRTGVRIRLPLG